MHELSVVQGIYQVVMQHATTNNAKKVKTVNLRIGELTDLMDEWIQRYFEFVAEKGIASGAKINVKRVPITVKCKACGKEHQVNKQDLNFNCPDCGEDKPELLAGREFTVESIEIE